MQKTIDFLVMEQKTDKARNIEVNNRYMLKEIKIVGIRLKKCVGNGGSPQICSGREFISLDLLAILGSVQAFSSLICLFGLEKKFVINTRSNTDVLCRWFWYLFSVDVSGRI